MIRPLRNLVIVQRFDTAVDKVGSIFIPDAARERPNQGDVIGVGPGRRFKCVFDDDGDGDWHKHKAKDGGCRIPLEVRVGDKILFGKYAGTDVKVDGRELLIVKEEEIMAVLE